MYPAYGGSISDRQLTERIELGKACDPGDQIMADKGFNIQDIVGLNDVHVNMPTFLKKGNQFQPKVLARDRQIASKKVHIERHIGLAKTYKMQRVTSLRTKRNVLQRRSQPAQMSSRWAWSEGTWTCSWLTRQVGSRRGGAQPTASASSSEDVNWTEQDADPDHFNFEGDPGVKATVAD